MTQRTARTEIVGPDERLVMIVGNFGSGKTEVAVNLALYLADRGRRVQIADLDLVNPYFRSREAQSRMEAHGIRVVVPPGSQVFADLPIVLPEIRGMLHPPEGVLTLFDVGGDDVGAKALASLRTEIGDAPYELWQVVNAKRPFTQDVAGCLAMQRAIEASSRLAVTGYLANAHLIEHTTAATVLEGWHLACALSEETGGPVRAVAVMEEIADDPALKAVQAPILRMHRLMLPPWLARSSPDAGMPPDGEGGERLPAARPVPLGRPRPLPFPRRGDADGSHRG